MTRARTARYAILFIVAFALVFTAAVAACGPDEPSGETGPAKADREALVALYSATDGENWSNKNNWLSDVPLGKWEGVDTADDGRVIGLDLSYNDLSGRYRRSWAASPTFGGWSFTATT